MLLRLLNLKVRRDHPHLTDMDVGQLVPLYLRQLYEQMNEGNPMVSRLSFLQLLQIVWESDSVVANRLSPPLQLFNELNEMNRAFEMPTGFGVNPMATNYIINPFCPPPSTQNTEPAYIHEID